MRSLEQGQEQLANDDWQEIGDRGLGSMDRSCGPLGFELDAAEFGQADWIEETPGDASSGVTGSLHDPDRAAPTSGLVPFHSWVETVAAQSAMLSEFAPAAAFTPVSTTTTTSGVLAPVSSGPIITGARLFPQAFAEEEEDPWQEASADPWSCAGSATSAAAPSVVSSASLAEDFERQIARDRASRPDFTELFSRPSNRSLGGCPPPTDEPGAGETFSLEEFCIATPSPVAHSWKKRRAQARVDTETRTTSRAVSPITHTSTACHTHSTPTHTSQNATHTHCTMLILIIAHTLISVYNQTLSSLNPIQLLHLMWSRRISRTIMKG